MSLLVKMVEVIKHQGPLVSVASELLTLANQDRTASRSTKRNLLELLLDSTLALPISSRGHHGELLTSANIESCSLNIHCHCRLIHPPDQEAR